MGRGRLEAFSDGVLAILITIMVLELKVPHGEDWGALLERWHVFLAYVLSFVYLGIYWSNHHHMLHVVDRVSGSVLWANLHLLFWLSLIPVATEWMGEHPDAAPPAATYGVILLGAALASLLLQTRLVRLLGPDSQLAKAVGNDAKGKLSAACYVAGIGGAFVHPLLAIALYAFVALIWLVPDRRIERQLPHATR
jgi:uncharacterized membrane protein